jgi:peptide/nickel transport system substrate-binding protein
MGWPTVKRIDVLGITLAAVIAGCAPPIPGAGRPSQNPGESPPATASRTLVMAGRAEPVQLGVRIVPDSTGVAITASRVLFNGVLALLDERGVPSPQLAESLPQLNTDSWQVFSDGRMETTYRLKPNLTWHDGTPLSALDFVFAWRAMISPEVGMGTTPPFQYMEELSAPDDRTLVIRWRQPFPEAGALGDGRVREFFALPRHILEGPFETQRDVFTSLPFWNTAYVGLGPFRLDRWEQGAFIEAAAFDGYAWGRPRIERIRIVFIADANTALANLLSGDAHVTLDDVIRFQQGAILKREWGPTNGGSVLLIPDQWRRTEIQQRADYASPRALLDVRVRRALAHTVDRQALNDALFEGGGPMADSPLSPAADYYPLVDRALVKYPYDPRQADLIMAEAGFARGSDGFFAGPSDGHLTWDLRVNTGPQAETEMAIMAANWRQLGFDFRETVVPAAQSRDGQARATFPTLFSGGGSVGDTVCPTSSAGWLRLPKTAG